MTTQQQPNSLSRDAVNQLQLIAQNALTSPDVQKIYANGFVNGIGFGDAYLILQTNGQSVAVVNMTYATLKSLSQNLTNLVEQLETQLGEPLPTIAEVQERVTASS